MDRIEESAPSGRRAEILFAAAKLIRDKGYAGATMRELAHSVGIEVSSLYNHIQSKQDLLVSICFPIGHKYIAGLEEIISSEMTYKKKMRAIIAMHIMLASVHKDAMQVFEEEWKHLADDDLVTFRQMRQNYENLLFLFIQRGIEAGKFASCDPHLMLYTLLSSMKWLNFYFKDQKTINSSRLTEELTGLIMSGNIRR